MIFYRFNIYYPCVSTEMSPSLLVGNEKKRKKVEKKNWLKIKEERISRNHSLSEALVAVDRGMSVRMAGKKFGINYASLHRRVQAAKEGKKIHDSRGPQPALNFKQEEALANYCVQIDELGYAFSR